MNLDAILQAGKAIDKAKRDLARLGEAKNLIAAEDAWLDFLNSFDRFFNKLEAGGRGCPKTVSWFGRVKHIRKKDHLLNYLNQARNCDHHGLEEVSHHEAGGIRIGAQGALHLRGMKIENGQIFADWSPAAPGSELVVTPFSSRLVAIPVVNRKVSFAVPETHLGQPLPDANVLTLGRIALTYAETLLQEAGERVG